jgi:hypothetical protein
LGIDGRLTLDLDCPAADLDAGLAETVIDPDPSALGQRLAVKGSGREESSVRIIDPVVTLGVERQKRRPRGNELTTGEQGALVLLLRL